jgi:S-DNA-T family DNA segregation ATPase FtsK/SpoIIIE
MTTLVRSTMKNTPSRRPLETVAWRLPDVGAILDEPTKQWNDQEEIRKQTNIIENALDDLGAPARVVQANKGPVITEFRLRPGFVTRRDGGRIRVKVGQIRSLANDLALALTVSPVHIRAPTPDSPSVAIEVPNRQVARVSLREVVETDAFERAKEGGALCVALGKRPSGEPVVIDLAQMPHLLIAGATGSGKSVCIHSIVAS